MSKTHTITGADLLKQKDDPLALQLPARATARAWLEAQVDPAVIEMLSEYFARTAKALHPTASITSEELALTADWLPTPQSVVDWMQPLGTMDAVTLAALAIHLLDIAEAMALEVFTPELPGLNAKSDRSADAARTVGTARYLRG